MEKIYVFFVLCLYVLGTIGGVGYTIYCGGYPIALGVVALAVMAYPKQRSTGRNLMINRRSGKPALH